MGAWRGIASALGSGAARTPPSAGPPSERFESSSSGHSSKVSVRCTLMSLTSPSNFPMSLLSCSLMIPTRSR